MTNAYRAVQWNRHKKTYDLAIVAGVVLYLVAFFVTSSTVLPAPSTVGPAPILLLRATATCAFLLLHVILAIGPLARLSTWFAPLLYNRRHLGVTMFCVAFVHGVVSFVFYHGLGDANPLVSLFVANTQFGSVAQFPFQLLGVLALGILFVMAATSHDFWLKNLGPGFWKALHMLVYLAYALIVAHVALGALQNERSGIYVVLVGVGAAVLTILHVAAGLRERGRARPAAASGEWVRVASVTDIPEGRAAIVAVGDGERIAIFRDGGALSAISNVCAHQGGPLGEGKVIDGCVTCPWHGYQYRARDGQSPPPFTERIATYRLRIDHTDVFLDPEPLPPGTDVEPAAIPTGTPTAPDDTPFYVGYLPVPARLRAAVVAFALVLPLTLGATGAVVASAQSDPGDGVWSDATAVAIEGHLQVDPYPILYVRDPASPDGQRGVFLVTQTKFGVAELARPLDGRSVRALGTFISRDGRTMFALEARDDALTEFEGEAPAPTLRELGRHRLVGEIADSKCYLGAMKPGLGKTHRACAVRCISGGIPPILVTQGADHHHTIYVLMDEAGKAVNAAVLDRVAEPVGFEGTLEQRGDLLLVRVDPKRIERL